MTDSVRDPLRLMLVDDHALVRAAIRQALSVPDIEMVGEASTAEEVLRTATDLRPDVILLDIDLPGMSGVDLVRELAPRVPACKIVMLTVSTDRRHLIDAIRHGAAGYLTKDLAGDALLRAIRGIRNGDLPMPRAMAAQALAHFAHGSGPVDADPAIASLSSRELEVLRLLESGMTDREIADALTISTRTVESHVSAVLRKLGVRNRAEAARRYRGSAEYED